jgi:hypothetical protein
MEHNGGIMAGKKWIEVFTILVKYNPQAGIAGAGHDIVYLDGEIEKMSAEDNKRMEKLGCHDNEGRWACFV